MRAFKWFLLAAGWVIGVGASIWAMFAFEMTPAATSRSPELWPANTALIRSFDRETLVMFVHPHCPCSRASIDELALLATSCANQLRITVIFLKPSGFADGWEKTDLWRSARGIPGVTVLCDDLGREASRFRASVSGEVLVYNRDGELIFHGGLTASRGHHGDNPGRTVIELLLAGKLTPPQTTPVFGCSLGERESPTASAPTSSIVESQR